MQTVIDGLLYDTQNATPIGAWDICGTNRGFFYREELHRTPNGRYFLYCVGRDAVCRRDGGRGERIIPLTKEKALEWCEEHIDHVDVTTILRFFGDIIEEA